MNKKIRKTLTATLTIIMLAFSAITAQAHEAVDMSRTDCGLTIEMNYGGKPVAGGELTLYRVGDVVESAGDFGFEWKKELNCTVGMENIESEDVAAKVMECVKQQKIEGKTAAIDQNGKAVFSNLEVGLYLVEQKTAAEGYTAINPFLISLPQWEDNHYNYTVTAAAKAELHKVPAPTETPKVTPGPKLPQTGQLNWPVPILLVLGATLLIVGYVLRRKNKDA